MLLDTVKQQLSIGNWNRLLLLLFFLGFNSIANQAQNTKLDSLKTSLSKATDSLEVGRLCLEIYHEAKFGLLIQNPEEGDYLLRALRIYEDQNDAEKIGKIYNALGGIYYNRKQFKKAREYWILSKEQYKKANNQRSQVVAFSNLSLTYLGDTTSYGQEQMKAYLDSALQTSNGLVDSCILSSIYDNLGAWHLRYGNLIDAEKYTDSSLAIAKKCNKYTTIQASTYQLGSIKGKQGDIEQAIYLIEKSLSYNALRKTDPNYTDAVLELSELYYLQGNYKTAYDYKSIYQSYKDTLFHIEQAKALLNLQMEYETEKKERIIMERESELLLMKANDRLKTKLIWIGGICTILVFGCIYVYRSYRYVLGSKKMEAMYSRQLIVAHEDERKRISQDLHDSVGQSLILIKNKVALNQDENTSNMVTKALEEVRSISKALHPAVLENLGLTAGIQKLVKDADEYSEIFFSEEIDAIDGFFDKGKELQIYRIIQECLNNILKHSMTESASVTVKDEPRRVVIQVKDYGVGFDLTENTGVITSLGMKTLKERTQLLAGKLMIESVKGNGTSITLYVAKL